MSEQDETPGVNLRPGQAFGTTRPTASSDQAASEDRPIPPSRAQLESGESPSGRRSAGTWGKPTQQEIELCYKIWQIHLMTKRVREPIQVYLSEAEREELDRKAGEMGVSRSEALRRGVAALRWTGSGRGAGEPDFVRELGLQDLVSPRLAAPGKPPPRAPVAPLEDLLAELSQDREDR
jgi:hypothetical protein